MQPTRERTPPPLQQRTVSFDAGLAWTLLRHLGSVGRNERGGLLLGRRDATKIRVTAVILPPQRVQAADHCVFDVRAIETFRNATGVLQSERLRRNIATIVGWVHTHPRLGLFLSHIDVSTFGRWRQLDGEAIAVVLDPYLGPGDRDRIAFWRSETLEVPDLGGQPPKTESIKFPDGSAIANAIAQVAPTAGAWEIVTPWNVVSLYTHVRPIPPSGADR
ncbi:Mov34/MPN/PAD-1 family protein [Dactylosporangium sp. CA-139066]|uniref:Mov34/MPN/PAD-1 family protein n=1 Tax=Dactylosporangium sp. CA-139066 TaxID=3239930 RepID=UPI003D914DFF